MCLINDNVHISNFNMIFESNKTNTGPTLLCLEAILKTEKWKVMVTSNMYVCVDFFVNNIILMILYILVGKVRIRKIGYFPQFATSHNGRFSILAVQHYFQLFNYINSKYIYFEVKSGISTIKKLNNKELINTYEIDIKS